MGEVLSQNEIDALLNQLSSGELDVESISNAEEKPVKDYDFSRPTKFSKEHLRTLEIIFEHYSRLVSTNLPVILRKNAQVTVASSETVTFSEFTNALSNPSVLGIVSFEPLGGNIIIDLATNIAFAMIDRMLGGEGEPLDKTREFSDIELSIMQKIMVMLTQLLRDPWKNVLEVSPVLTRLETNPSFAQIIAPGEMIAVITLNIKIGDVEGFMNMCLPFITLEDVIAGHGVVALKNQPEIARSYSGQTYKTTSGKIDLYYENLISYGQALPQYEAPNEAYAGNPLAEKYPLHMTQRRSKYFIHQNYYDATWIRQFYEPTLEMNPADAAKRGIKSGDMIQAFNDRGSFKCKCVTSEAIRPGMAVIVEGIWPKYMGEGSLQNVTNDAANPRGVALAKGRVTPFNDTLVEVKKA